MASEWPLRPKISHFRSPVCSSHVLTPHNASMNDPETGLGLHQLGGWHCQCIFGLRKAFPPQTPPISTSSMLLLRADATQCFPERSWGWVGAASARRRAQRWLAWTLKVGRSAWFLFNNLCFIMNNRCKKLFWAEVGAKQPNYGQNRTGRLDRPCTVRTVLFKHTVLAPSCTVQIRYGPSRRSKSL